MPKFLIIFLSAVLTLNAQVSSFLFAGEINNTNILSTENAIIQHTCNEHTCDQESELVFYNDGINSIASLNISTDYQTRDNFNIDYPDLPESVIMSRDGETIYQFTNCGQTGRYGPSQSQANSSYSGTSLDGSVTVTDGIQYWTIPSSGTYTIEAWGAQGGSAGATNTAGGLGALMKGDFDFSAGDVIGIMVGQIGGSHNHGGGGGGGTFIVNSDNTALIIGGGGGGGNGYTGSSRGYNQGGNGLASTSGGNSSQTTGNYGNAAPGSGGGNRAMGGINGYGGGGAVAGGGAGFYGDGGNGSYSANGLSYLNGGAGGAGNYNDNYGGFGGGAGGQSGSGYGGGAGGYSGGGGGNWNGSQHGNGGGGGSYNAGVNQDNQGGIRSGHGQLIITSAAPSNTAPTATAQSVTGNEDSPQTITLAGSDAEGDALTYALATNPSNGTWTLSGNVVTYTPNTNYNGSDNFTFTVFDGELTSSAATVNISITAVNDAPTATTQSVTDNEDVTQTITLSGTDVDGDNLTYALAANPSNGTWTLSGNVVTYTPNANYNGSDNFTFTVSDGELTSSAATVNISITTVNDAPTASAQSVSGNEDAAQTITLAGSDAEGDALTYALATNPSNGTSTLSGNVVTYTPNTNYNGSDSFTFTVSDAELTSTPATISITVTAVNDAPTAAVQSASGNEDEAQEITLAGNDADGDALTYALATNPSNGTSTLIGNVVTYTPNTNYNGSDNFTFTVSDAEYTSSAATVSITVASVNDLPVILSTPSLDALDGSLYEYSISVNDVDEDVVAITATGPNWLIVDNGTLSGTPSPSDGGLHQIVLSANDGNGGVVTQSYTLAVSLHSLVITGESGYRIFSSPVSGTIYGDLLDELWTQGAEGSDSPNSNPNIWTYGNGWNSVTDFSSDALTAGKGFLMYIFADIDFDGDDDLNDPENPVIISIDGAQQESGVSVVSEPSGWNLIGNPYGLSVDISQMLSDNNGTFNSTIYALDHTNPGYKTHNGVVGNIENDEIKPFDGFWIKADADGNVFEFTEQSILKGSLNNAGRTTTDDSNGSAVFTFTNGDYSSSTYLSFTPEGQINLDPADAYRLVPMSPAEHLTSMIHESGKSLSINNLPLDLSSDISFPMDVMMLSPTEDGYETQAEQVNLSWDVTNLPAGITLELNNNITGQNINLTGYPSANINLPSKGGFSTSGDFMATYPVVGQSQFTLSVYGTLAAVEDDVLPERLTLHSAYPNPFNPSTLIRFDLSNADMVSLDIFDIAGKQVASLISEYMIPGSHQINWNPGNLSSGLYLVNLVVGTETFNQKITFIK